MSFLLNPFRFGVPAAPSLAGYNTPTAFKDSTSQQVFVPGGWVYPVVAGELIVISMHAMGDGTLINPSNFTLSLGGAAMTRRTASATATVNNHPGSAHFTLVAGVSGTLQLSADCAVSARACALICRRITGFDAGTPIGAGLGAPSKLNADDVTLTGAGITTGRAGNVVIGDACTKAGTATTASSTAFDGMAYDTTGATTISDLGFGFGHKLLPAPTLITPDWTFDVSGRLSGSFVEINVAP